jgi:phosphoglycerol transferase
MAAQVRADRQFGRALESALPRGAMVFQLPVLGFPEVLTPYRLGDYEHFRPYLATQHLRFSYGAPKMRPQSRWQRDLENVPVAELIQRLEHHGFAALYFNRRGYKDGGESILQKLNASDYQQHLTSVDDNQVAVFLRPSAKPVPPLAKTVTYGQGWHMQPEDGWRLAYEDAALSYFNPYPDSLAVELQFDVMGVTPRELVLARDGETLHHIQAKETPTTQLISRLVVVPGVNRFKLRTSAAAIRQGVGRNQLQSFGVHNVAVRRTRDATAARDSGNGAR